jgi:hypothetical protein
MGLSLRESQAASDLAEVLYRFLPGAGSPTWKGHVSFKSIAADLGIGHFWQTGSKTPAIARLIENTLEYRRDLFEPLILRVVREGIRYCDKGGNPITVEEIEKLNGLILEVGFKFPDLWDERFLSLLRTDPDTRARQTVQLEKSRERVRIDTKKTHQEKLQRLCQTFLTISEMENRQKAGHEFEAFLNELFELEGL